MEPAFRCAGCGSSPLPTALPFVCPAANGTGDVDHVLVRVNEPGPAGDPAEDLGSPVSGNPFVRYRRRLSAYALARAHGLADGDYVDLVRSFDHAVAGVDGHGFFATPFVSRPQLAAALAFEEGGELWVKDETGNVSGSHKARHLAGIMLYLLVAEQAGLLKGRQPLAIASCGNAALAAAVVANAARWPLRVFVPSSANHVVLARLERLGADVTTCRRQAGVPGDPCYLAFRGAVARGAVPFCCQGSDNGLTIEGGKTIAWEMISTLRDAPMSPWGPASAGSPFLDAIVVQVGGGALASAVAQGFAEAQEAGEIARVPRFYVIQTAGGFPLARAYDRLVAWMLSRWPDGEEPPSGSPEELARAITGQPALVDEALAFARLHRSQFMWPWEEEPRSIAHGILDDETYDWAASVDAMLRTGGRPIVASEARLCAANDAARAATGIDADHTGTAGLAGLMKAVEQEASLRRSRVAVIFSGIRRA